MFGEFNEATQLKTSLTKYSMEFNDLAIQIRPHRIAYLRLLGRPYTLLYVRRSVGRLEIFVTTFWFCMTSQNLKKNSIRRFVKIIVFSKASGSCLYTIYYTNFI